MLAGPFILFVGRTIALIAFYLPIFIEIDLHLVILAAGDRGLNYHLFRLVPEFFDQIPKKIAFAAVVNSAIGG